jgi:hypothetical protein
MMRLGASSWTMSVIVLAMLVALGWLSTAGISLGGVLAPVLGIAACVSVLRNWEFSGGAKAGWLLGIVLYQVRPCRAKSGSAAPSHDDSARRRPWTPDGGEPTPAKPASAPTSDREIRARSSLASL